MECDTLLREDELKMVTRSDFFCCYENTDPKCPQHIILYRFHTAEPMVTVYNSELELNRALNRINKWCKENKKN